MDRGYTPQQFEGLFATAAASDANHKIHRLLYMDRGYTLNNWEGCLPPLLATLTKGSTDSLSRNLAPRCANAEEANAVRAYIRGK